MTRQRVVYGTDNRVEVYANPSDPIAEIARTSVLALIAKERLSRQRDNTWTVASRTAKERHDLCPNEPFASQPAAADCSATLITKDLVITAGHCVWSESTCRSFAFVFNYWYEKAGLLATIDEQSVYHCQKLVVTETSTDNDPPIDLAVVKLDRPVIGFQPVVVASRKSVSIGSGVVLVGTPEGVPIKLDRGTVQSFFGEPSVGFKSNVDAFLGSSGSGVFSEDGQLVGVLSSGQDDFLPAEDCQTSRRLDEAAGDESVFWAEQALNGLCTSSNISASFCEAPVETPDVDATDAGESLVDSGTPQSEESRSTGCNLSGAGRFNVELFGFFWFTLWAARTRRRNSRVGVPFRP